jgi:hypothetical protein
MSKFLAPLCGTLALVTLTTTAGAQVGEPKTAELTVSATVSTQLTNTVAQHLDFQTVYPGIAKSIAPNHGAAGKFLLTGGIGAQVTYSFSLVSELDHATSPAAKLSIGSWFTCNSASITASGCIPAGASGSFTANLTGGAAGNELYIFIGATVTPTNSQLDGAYSGKITLTAAYITT